jgi:thioredoxin 1
MDGATMENEQGIVIELSDNDLGDAVSGNTLLVVDCWAPWCGDCRRMAPVFDDLAKDNRGKVKFAKINIDHNQDTKTRYDIMAIPTLLFFKEGKLVDRKVEPPPKKTLLQNDIDRNFA